MKMIIAWWLCLMKLIPPVLWLAIYEWNRILLPLHTIIFKQMMKALLYDTCHPNVILLCIISNFQVLHSLSVTENHQAHGIWINSCSSWTMADLQIMKNWPNLECNIIINSNNHCQQIIQFKWWLPKHTALMQPFYSRTTCCLSTSYCSHSHMD